MLSRYRRRWREWRQSFTCRWPSFRRSTGAIAWHTTRPHSMRTYWNSAAQLQLSPAVVPLAPGDCQRQLVVSRSVMPDWAQRVRATGFRIALLSNMPFPVRDYFVRCRGYRHSTRRRSRATSTVLSRRPRFMGILSRPSASADRTPCLLDDRVENVRAAEAVGIHAILFTIRRPFARTEGPFRHRPAEGCKVGRAVK